MASMLESATETPQLSVVIPAYNEERRIAATLEAIIVYLAGRFHYEIIVVDDGSCDRTASIVRAYAERQPEIQLRSLRRRCGKGAAVQDGMLHATGQVLCFSDADLSTPIDELERMLPLLRRECDIVIGSRALPASQIVRRQAWWRELMGKVFNVMMRRVLHLPFHDTQCGFKCFRREAARAIFTRTHITGFAFDVEVLVVARALGLVVCEVPVRWAHVSLSRVHPVLHSIEMCRDVWRIAHATKVHQP